VAITLGAAACGAIVVDRSRLGPAFDGLGAISGGGATSRLLPDYPEPQRSDILDLLFLPNHGASLQILKVEIGGDSQTTDGTEASHMHAPDVTDWNAGYEWWLMVEAKRRNPAIKLYGLPWAFPGWVGNGSASPLTYPALPAEYVTSWVAGARDHYNLTIDYIGIWNEKLSDAAYVKALRAALNREGFAATQIVAKDGWADICANLASDPEYAAAVDVVGLHYPDDFVDYAVCHSFGKPVWASEESSSYDDLNGAACWARVVTSHFVRAGITSSIMWNLLGAYYHGTDWYASSLMTADQPWSGHYDVSPVLWATAHVTQHTPIGWRYLPVGSGSGELPRGGYYTTLVEPDGRNFTIQVVKISRSHAACTRPPLPAFTVEPETVVFELHESMGAVDTLAVWYSNYEGLEDAQFVRLSDIHVASGRFELHVDVGAYITVSTLRGARKGRPGPIPPSRPHFPLPHTDDFDRYAPSGQAAYLADQIGCFEVHIDQVNAKNKVLRQMVPALPIGWSDAGTRGPVTVVGQREWQDLTIRARFRVPSNDVHACIATRVDQMWTKGIVLCLSSRGTWNMTIGGPLLHGSAEVVASGQTRRFSLNEWHTVTLTTIHAEATALLDGRKLSSTIPIRDIDTGFAALGTNRWGPVEFDELRLAAAGPDWRPLRPAAQKAGAVVEHQRCARNGVPAPDQQWVLEASWQLRHVASGLCATAASDAADSEITLQPCTRARLQLFQNDYTNVRNKEVPLYLESNHLMVLSGGPNSTVSLRPRGLTAGHWQAWAFFPNSGRLRNQYTAIVSLGPPRCLGVPAANGDAKAAVSGS